MKLWMVANTGKVDYDEYDSFVIRAASADDARAVVAAIFDDDWDKRFKKFWRTSPLVTVTEIPAQGDPGIILGSFNAG
jgi:hypothetical protein